LKQAGVAKGDKVALVLPNVPEFFYFYFAAVKLGAVAVPLNTSSTPYELNYLLDNSDAKVLITIEGARKRYEEVQDRLTTCKKIIVVDDPEEKQKFNQLLKSSDLQEISEDINPDDPAAMIYTSGLTGKALGAVLTHRNLYSQSHLIDSCVKRKHKDIGLCLIPLFHSFGSTVNMINVVRTGCSVVMMDRFTMDGLFGAIQKEKITYICAVPRLYLGMIFHEGAANFDISSLEVCVTGGAAMPPDFIAPFEEKFGAKIVEGYGLTEASPACSFNMLDRPQKPGSIGKAVPRCEIKIVDEEGNELPRGQVGELIVRGENVMLGYYKDEKATASVIKNGWLHTGDLGRMDEDDYVFLTGLKKRMIITSGFNVYPKEIEDVLNIHPAVREVEVVGKKDLMRGEVVLARILLENGATVDDKEILKYCRTYLSSYKVPREVEFVQKIDN
jgi:long-chain acyl-CoA synthetase